MNKILVEKIPLEFKESVQIAAFFIKGSSNEPIKRRDLAFVSSSFYNTRKMRCFDFYKPAFL